MVKGNPAANIADIEKLEIVFKDRSLLFTAYCLPPTAFSSLITGVLSFLRRFCEPNLLALWFQWGHELPNSIKHYFELCVILPFDFAKLMG